MGGKADRIRPHSGGTEAGRGAAGLRSRGAVSLIDAKTGNEVNLQNTEVKEVSKDEFKAAVGKK